MLKNIREFETMDNEEEDKIMELLSFFIIYIFIIILYE